MFSFPSILHSDNGKEFKSKTMSELCKKHKIKQAHGATRTPSTQGLVERNNRTAKENILNILKERCQSLGKCCLVLSEAAYKKSITEHNMKLCLVYSQGKRYLMEQKKITLRKVANDNHGRKKCTHPSLKV